ncbi:hypothetical protein [Listeria welshimeri]|nr:hypothetical protein [Listeria welshimeri]
MNGIKEAYQEASAKGFAYTLCLFLECYFGYCHGIFRLSEDGL